MLGFTCGTILLTIILANMDLKYGVIIPSMLEKPHVLHNGVAVPLVKPPPPAFSRRRLRKGALMAGKALVATTMILICFIFTLCILNLKWNYFNKSYIVAYEGKGDSFDPYNDEFGLKEFGKYDYCYY